MDNTENQPFDQQETPSHTLIAQGTYTAHAIAHGLTETQAGAPQFAIEFEIDNEGPDASRRITGFFGFGSPKAEAFTFEVLATCGWDGQTALDAIPALPTQVKIVIEHEEYNGNWNARVRYVNPIDWQRPAGALIEKRRMEPTKAAQLGADLLARYRMGKGGSNAPDTGAKRAPATPSAPSTGSAQPARAVQAGGRPVTPGARASSGTTRQAPGRAAPASVQQARADEEIPF